MDLRQLRYLIAVAEESTIIGAAERLRVAQPALSRQIHALEREVGIPLFERRARGVAITPAGEATLAAARQISDSLADVIEQARAADEGLAGTCVVCASPRVVATGLIARVVASVRARYPQIELLVRETNFVRQWEAIRSGDADLGLGIPAPARYKDILSETVIEDVFDAAALALAHPLADRETLSLADLSNETFLTWQRWVAEFFNPAVEAEFANAGVTIRRRREFDDTYALVTAVRAGQGWALFPRLQGLLAPDAKTIPLVDCRILVPHAILRLRGEPSPVVATVSDAIRAVMRCEAFGVAEEPHVRAPRQRADIGLTVTRIELRQLRYYCAAVNAGSFGRAAEQLDITQPALSRQIRALERDVKVPLLDRGSRGAAPTGAGRMFYDGAVGILEQAGAIQREARRAERGRRARCIIAGVPTLVVQRLLQTLLTRSESFGIRADITVSDLPTPRQAAALRAAEIDLGVCHAIPLSSVEEEGIRRTPLRDDRLNRALLPAGHSLGHRSALRLNELAGIPFLFVDRSSRPLLYEQVFAAFDTCAFRPHVEETYDGLQTVWALIAQGRGWSLGFESQTNEPPAGTIAVPLEDLSLSCGVQALVRSDEARPSILSILEMLIEIARE